MKPWYKPGPGWYEIPDDPPEDERDDFDPPFEPYLSEEDLDREALKAENRRQARIDRMARTGRMFSVRPGCPSEGQRTALATVVGRVAAFLFDGCLMIKRKRL